MKDKLNNTHVFLYQTSNTTVFAPIGGHFIELLEHTTVGSINGRQMAENNFQFGSIQKLIFPVNHRF